MKLEQYRKQTGAFLRPMFREVPEDTIVKRKGERSINVEAIVVNVTLESGEIHDFQGDEVSQDRLIRNGWVMEHTTISSIPWKTADNQVVQLVSSDINAILLAAIHKQTELWF